MESTKKASYSGDSGQADLNNDSSEDPSDCEKPSCGNEGYTRIESGSKRIGSGLKSKGKRKRNRRKERKRIKFKSKSLKVYGINAAGLSSKLESF